MAQAAERACVREKESEQGGEQDVSDKIEKEMRTSKMDVWKEQTDGRTERRLPWSFRPSVLITNGGFTQHLQQPVLASTDARARRHISTLLSLRLFCIHTPHDPTMTIEVMPRSNQRRWWKESTVYQSAYLSCPRLLCPPHRYRCNGLHYPRRRRLTTSSVYPVRLYSPRLPLRTPLTARRSVLRDHQ